MTIQDLFAGAISQDVEDRTETGEEHAELIHGEKIWILRAACLRDES